MMDISTLKKADLAPENPLDIFGAWFETAKTTEPNDPDAMCLATVTADGKPSARMVLLKDASDKGFKFHTNSNSRKGHDLAANSFAALCFHWKSMQKQVRIEGRVEIVDAAEADAYYATRPYGRQIGGWASAQSEKMTTRSDLQASIQKVEDRFKDTVPVPRPPYWNGYRVIPERIEFWDNGEDRLHTRLLYEKDGENWVRSLLYP